MKMNTPVTTNEILLPAGEQLVSTTDLKGRITSINEAFVRVSGFSREELLGKSHNVVRHPEMPAAAFQNLWDDLKAGKHWMGLVKNRCKNGDFYWVDAFVTPIIENSVIVGYESVRVKASDERIKAAEQTYARLNKPSAKLPAIGGSLFTRLFICALLIITSLSVFAYFNHVPLLLLVVMGPIVLLSAYGGIAYSLKPLTAAAKSSQTVANNPVIQYLYTGRHDAIGQIQFANLMLEGRLRTVVGRIEGAVEDISQSVEHLASSSEDSYQGVMTQQGETSAVLHAMGEMNSAVQEVARNASNSSVSTIDAAGQVNDSKEMLSSTVSKISELVQSISISSDVIKQLETDSDTINGVLDVIRSISEQTNLLALNAAIEAARAGEHGRGFAVVADEIRSLSMRTEDSTIEIQSILEQLQQRSQQASKAMSTGEEQVEMTVKSARKASASLDLAAAALVNIEGMSLSIAAAVEEQSQVASAINNNVEQINTLANDSAGRSENDRGLCGDLLKQAKGLHNMALRFKGENVA